MVDLNFPVLMLNTTLVLILVERKHFGWYPSNSSSLVVVPFLMSVVKDLYQNKTFVTLKFDTSYD